MCVINIKHVCDIWQQQQRGLVAAQHIEEDPAQQVSARRSMFTLCCSTHNIMHEPLALYTPRTYPHHPGMQPHTQHLNHTQLDTPPPYPPSSFVTFDLMLVGFLWSH